MATGRAVRVRFQAGVGIKKIKLKKKTVELSGAHFFLTHGVSYKTSVLS
jgi:hypothetical protein